MAFPSLADPGMSQSQTSSGMASPYRMHSRSRTQSISSDRPSTIATSSLSFMSPPLSVSPEAAFIASSAASQIVTNDHDSHADSWYDQHGIEPSGETAMVSPSALQLVNNFLDQLLLNFLAVARSTTLTALRPAVAEVLKPKLAKDAVNQADEELQEYLGGADDELMQSLEPQAPADWDLELVWKRTRLRCMVYSSLGDMEEEDEDFYMERENLDDGSSGGMEDRLSSEVVSPAVAIFLTSILEFMGEQALVVAGQAAYHRMRVKFEKELKEGLKSPADMADRIVVEELDMERVALDRTLGRLWRSWKKKIRSPAIGGGLDQSLMRHMSRDSLRGSSTHLRSPSVTAEPWVPATVPEPEAVAMKESNGEDSTTQEKSGEVEEKSTDEATEVKSEETEAEVETDPTKIPLPMGPNDVNEIEVPGLVSYDDEEAGESDQNALDVPTGPPRPKSLMIFPQTVKKDLPSPAMSQPRTPDMTVRKRSNSLPTPAATPFTSPSTKTTTETEDATIDEKVVEQTESVPTQATGDEISTEEIKPAVDVVATEAEASDAPARAASPEPISENTTIIEEDDEYVEEEEDVQILTSSRISISGRSTSPAASVSAEEQHAAAIRPHPINTNLPIRSSSVHSLRLIEVTSPRSPVSRSRGSSVETTEHHRVSSARTPTERRSPDFTAGPRSSIGLHPKSGLATTESISEAEETNDDADGVSPLTPEVQQHQPLQSQPQPQARRIPLSTQPAAAAPAPVVAPVQTVTSVYPTPSQPRQQIPQQQPPYQQPQEQQQYQAPQQQQYQQPQQQPYQPQQPLFGSVNRHASPPASPAKQATTKVTILPSSSSISSGTFFIEGEPDYPGSRPSSSRMPHSSPLSATVPVSAPVPHDSPKRSSPLQSTSGYGSLRDSPDLPAPPPVVPERSPSRQAFAPSPVREQPTPQQQQQPSTIGVVSVERPHGRTPSEKSVVSRDQPRQLHTSGSASTSSTAKFKPMRTSEEDATTPVSRADVVRDFEQLIQSDQTIQYTLTPEGMRDIGPPSVSGSPVVPVKTRRSEDTRNGDYRPRTTSVTPVTKSVELNRAPSVSRTNGLNAHPLSNAALDAKASGTKLNGPVPRSMSAVQAAPSSSRTGGPQARDARLNRESLAEFADFIRSTGPPGAVNPSRAIANSSAARSASGPAVGSKGSIDEGRVSIASSRTRARLQARDAAIDYREDSSDLIDFIRRGPPATPGNHRIPRTVAPFRTTMDSDQMSGAMSGSGGGRTVDNGLRDLDIRSSAASTSFTENSMPSVQSSINSQSALLNNRNKPLPGGNANSRLAGIQDDDDNDMPIPKRKTRRVRDPYAIDLSDEDDEDEGYGRSRPAAAPKEESLAEFLRNVPPPPPEPEPPAHIVQAQNRPRKKSSAPSLMARFTRRGSEQHSISGVSVGGGPKSPSLMSGRNPMQDSRSLTSRAGGGRGYIPIQVNIPSLPSTSHGAGAGPGAGSSKAVAMMGVSTTISGSGSGSGGRVPMKKFEPRDAVSVPSRGTSDLAAFLKNSEPPMGMGGGAPVGGGGGYGGVQGGGQYGRDDGGGMSKMFARRKKAGVA